MKVGAWIVAALLVLGGSQLADAAMRVKLQIIDQIPASGHLVDVQMKITLYKNGALIEEYGISATLNADTATTPAAAITFLKNQAVTFATNQGMSPAPIASEVFVFGGPQ